MANEKRLKTCGDCIHADICKQVNSGWFSPENIAYCKAFKDKATYVELPCSYGKTIYAVGNKKIVECEVDEISFGVIGLMYLVSFDCDSDCDGCPFHSWKQGYSGEWSCDGEYNQACVKGCDFGKTVFLTREEAEAALAKMDGDWND